MWKNRTYLCRIKEKLNNLEIDEKEKQQLLELIKKDETDNDILSTENDEEDIQINELIDASTDSEEDNECINNIGICYPSINVMSSNDKKFFLELIDKFMMTL